MSFKDRLFICSQYLLPHHLLSRLIGFAADCRATWFKDRLIAWFARRYQVDMREAQVEDLQAYEHFNAFFTRALKDGARPLAQEPGAVLCPADGAISQLGPIEHGRIFQAKGHSYSLAELLGGDAELAAPFMGGDFATVYLSPGLPPRPHAAGRHPARDGLRSRPAVLGEPDHRGKRPRAVRPQRAGGLPVRHRARSDGRGAGGRDDRGLHRNRLGRPGYAAEARTEDLPLRRSRPRADPPGKGAELGRFKLGSTAIVLFGPQQIAFNDGLGAASPVRMGECLALPKQA